MFAILAALLLAVPAAARADTVFEAFPGLPDFAYPVAVVDPMDATRRLFVPELGGRIYVFQNDPGVSSRALFLDISDEFTLAGEGGLLGLAFDPAFETNGHCYVTYTVDNPRREILARFTADPANPDTVLAGSRAVIKEIPKQSLAHNGGHIIFGPDGYMYWGLGDDQVIRYAQDLTTWNGKLLRIDVDTPSDSTLYSVPPDNPFVATGGGVHPEIWAFGLRNPWRFSFDPPTGRLWLGDVGQSRWEEIDLIHKGRNYGWSRMEGEVCYPFVSCDTTGLNLIAPLFVYPHPPGSGASITGGYVYRGRSAPAMVGKYIYADYITGDIRALTWDGVNPPTSAHIDTLGSITSFGVDQDYELYCVSFDGNIYQVFAPAPTPPKPSRNAIVRVTPNPFRFQTTIEFDLAAAGRAILDVFDVAGRRIARISDASASAGNNTAQWDGRNNHGEPVGSGVYFIRLSLDGNQADTRRLILLK